MVNCLYRTFMALIVGLSFCLNSAHAIVLTTIEGKNIPFSHLKGKRIFINYWASWCQPCLDEIKTLNRFYRENKDIIALFAVNYDELPLRDQKTLVKQLKIEYPSLQQNASKLLHVSDIPAVPLTVVFNDQGERVMTLYGPQTMSNLKRSLMLQ